MHFTLYFIEIALYNFISDTVLETQLILTKYSFFFLKQGGTLFNKKKAFLFKGLLKFFENFSIVSRYMNIEIKLF